ncbi:hypothetical protein J0J30_23955, partial [Vibrio vulnificus]|nr:hypothetical protein [Vibrio vulnificus]
ITKKTDVYSLGILILEILTGKFPPKFLPQSQGKGRDKEEDLVNWVHSVPQEEWIRKVLDKDIGAIKGHESEAIKLLKIGLCCCER